MADEEGNNSQPENPPTEAIPNTAAPITTQDRTELLARARSFLTSPQVALQDTDGKRRFLADKGLNDIEIEGLLREAPQRRPLIPPRAYPQLPPSNLPNLLIGIARLLSWVVGGSAALLFVYHRFLLPKIAKTSVARHSIKSHHLGLMHKLTASLVSLKEVQAQSFAVLPRPEPHKEPPQFSKLKSVTDILKQAEKHGLEVPDLSPITLLRCGIADLGRGMDGEAANPSTQDLFRYLEGHIPWLVSEEGLQFEQTLWSTLSTCPSFTATTSPPASAPAEEEMAPRPLTCWTYTTLIPPDPSPIHKSFAALSSALPSHTTPRKSPTQNTLQTLSDFTGYISTQVYLPYRAPTIGSANGTLLGPVEEEVKKDIRALKGLVLNRRSFMPPIPRHTPPGSQRS